MCLHFWTRHPNCGHIQYTHTDYCHYGRALFYIPSSAHWLHEARTYRTAEYQIDELLLKGTSSIRGWVPEDDVSLAGKSIADITLGNTPVFGCGDRRDVTNVYYTPCAKCEAGLVTMQEAGIQRLQMWYGAKTWAQVSEPQGPTSIREPSALMVPEFSTPTPTPLPHVSQFSTPYPAPIIPQTCSYSPGPSQQLWNLPIAPKFRIPSPVPVPQLWTPGAALPQQTWTPIPIPTHQCSTMGQSLKPSVSTTTPPPRSTFSSPLNGSPPITLPPFTFDTSVIILTPENIPLPDSLPPTPITARSPSPLNVQFPLSPSPKCLIPRERPFDEESPVLWRMAESLNGVQRNDSGSSAASRWTKYRSSRDGERLMQGMTVAELRALMGGLGAVEDQSAGPGATESERQMVIEDVEGNVAMSEEVKAAEDVRLPESGDGSSEPDETGNEKEIEISYHSLSNDLDDDVSGDYEQDSLEVATAAAVDKDDLGRGLNLKKIRVPWKFRSVSARHLPIEGVGIEGEEEKSKMSRSCLDLSRTKKTPWWTKVVGDG